MLAYKLENKTMSDINDIINKHKTNFEDQSHNTSTVNGFQSNNIEHLFNKDLKKRIINYNNLHKDIFHMHYIEYFEKGFQKEHNHQETEEWSFILYLNDAIGDTVFENFIFSPEKGLLVLFDSKLKHKGKKSFNKKILVGAIKKKIN